MMQIAKKLNIEKLFFWSLGLSAACIPLPGNNFSSFSLILLIIIWIFYQPVKSKWVLLKSNSKSFLILLIPLLLAGFGLIYTDNFEYGLRKIDILLPFLFYPLALLSIPKERQLYRFVLYCFSFSTFLTALIAVMRAAYLKFNNLGEFFYYYKFSELLDKHTTYFSLFVVISLLFLFSETLKKRIKPIAFIIAAVFFLFVLYIVSARISIIALGIGGLILIMKEIKSKKKYLFLLFLFLLGALYTLPNFQKRFELNQTESGEITDWEFRNKHWLAVIETIKHNPILIGAGTGSNRDFLYERYQHYQLTSAYELEYNAHNQYLEFVLDYGLIGLISVLFLLTLLFYYLWINRSNLGISLLMVFVIYFMTESLLQRSDGIMTFSLLMSTFLNSKTSVNKF